MFYFFFYKIAFKCFFYGKYDKSAFNADLSYLA